MSNKQNNQTKQSNTVDVYYMGSCSFIVPVYEKKEAGEVGAINSSRAIFIEGGAGIAFSDKDRAIRNRTSVKTTLSAEDYNIVKEDSGFKAKVAAGFITINTPPTEIKKDKSAQLTTDGIKKKNPKVVAVTNAPN